MFRYNVIVIGGGPAGMMAALAAADAGRVLLLDGNEKLGKKLYITGKGRCNLTNACSRDELIGNTLRNGRFMYSVYSVFDNNALMAYMEGLGVPLKIERGDRVFPVSDHASDITRALERELGRKGVEVRLNTKVSGLITEENVVTGVRLAGGGTLSARRVIVATGGRSYPSTGSTGDGYAFAAALGHKVVQPTPSLTPIVAKESWCGALQGLALKNVRLTVVRKKKKLYTDIGEMIFTEDGVGGPLVLTASAYLSGAALEGCELQLDVKPALAPEVLDKRLLRDLEKYANRSIGNSLFELLPKRLADALLSLSGIDPQTPCHQLTRENRSRFVETMKKTVITPAGLRPLQEAVITRGGVDCREIDPSTMGSRKVAGLYFAGEVLDVDALTGGFNLQVAFSSGYCAGKHAAESIAQTDAV